MYVLKLLCRSSPILFYLKGGVIQVLAVLNRTFVTVDCIKIRFSSISTAFSNWNHSYNFTFPCSPAISIERESRNLIVSFVVAKFARYFLLSSATES